MEQECQLCLNLPLIPTCTHACTTCTSTGAKEIPALRCVTCSLDACNFLHAHYMYAAFSPFYKPVQLPFIYILALSCHHFHNVHTLVHHIVTLSDVVGFEVVYTHYQSCLVIVWDLKLCIHTMYQSCLVIVWDLKMCIHTTSHCYKNCVLSAEMKVNWTVVPAYLTQCISLS